MVAPTDLGPLGEITCVAGDAFAISGPDGDLRPGGDHGVYVRDTRFLHRLELRIDGRRPRPLSGQATAAGRAQFHSHVPRSGDRGVDPTLLITRRRIVDGCLHEDVEVDNRSPGSRTVKVELRCGTDFAYIFDVKHDRHLPALEPTIDDGAMVFRRPGAVEHVVVVPTPVARIDGDRMSWTLDIPPRSSARVRVHVVATDVYGTARPPLAGDGAGAAASPPPGGRGGPRLRCSEIRLSRLVRRSLQDLDSLETPDPLGPDDRFYAAGTPWYLTLFGRDALWAAFMALPYRLDVAAGTLRALARRQGTRLDPQTEEAPGKILHEVRRGGLVHRGDLPPNYYGTIDATPLFVILLDEAWRWGLPEDQVETLLPNLEAALRWMIDSGAPDGDGFLKYRRQGDRGLDNQGWKDSHDGIQFADGRLARPPIALVEVQAYAYAAAHRAADLLERFGRDGGPWRTWAADFKTRFHERFWLEDDLGRYLAIALDGDGTPIDAPTSNMGHVLTTGILDAPDARMVARRLAHPTLSSGWGLRTLSTTAAGFNPLAYHAGSVWPHDTAIAAYGCALAGERDAVAALTRGLVAAAPHFGYRLPELFAGLGRDPGGFPVPYPAACRPQAWSAAGALLLLRACLRPDPHLPDRRLTLAPLWPPVFRRLRLTAVPVGGGTLDVSIDEQDGIHVAVAGTDVEVTVEDADLPVDIVTRR